MKGKVHLVSTKFSNLKGEKATFGFRIFCEDSQDYDNLCKMPISDDMDILRYAYVNHIKSGDETAKMLNDVAEKKNGMKINSTWYPWAELEPHFASFRS